MQVHLVPGSDRVERPAYVWIALVLEIVTGVAAVPVGWWFISDPSGRAMRLPEGWIEATPFGSYLVPGSTSSQSTDSGCSCSPGSPSPDTGSRRG